MAARRKFRGKDGKRGEGLEEAGARDADGAVAATERETVMNGGGVARNSVQVKRAYITAPSIYTDELPTPRERRAVDRRIYIYAVHPRTVSACTSSIYPALPARRLCTGCPGFLEFYNVYRIGRLLLKAAAVRK